MNIDDKNKMNSKDRKKSIYHVGALERGLSVLEYIAMVRRPVRLQEIVQELKINFTSATRMCTTLIELGFIRRDEQKFYFLTTKVLTLGFAVLNTQKWINILEIRLKQLFDEIKQTVNLGVLSDENVLYLIRLRKDKYLPFDIQVGSKLPLHCTALGKVLLAFSRPQSIDRIWGKLELSKIGPNSITQIDVLKKQIYEVKKKGYSISDEELTPNVIAAGCPILDKHGFALMAINVTVKKSEITKKELINMITPKLIMTSQDIEKILIDMKIDLDEVHSTL